MADTVLVRYFAAASDAAGKREEVLTISGTVGDLRLLLVERYGDAMARVLDSG